MNLPDPIVLPAGGGGTPPPTLLAPPPPDPDTARLIARTDGFWSVSYHGHGLVSCGNSFRS